MDIKPENDIGKTVGRFVGSMRLRGFSLSVDGVLLQEKRLHSSILDELLTNDYCNE